VVLIGYQTYADAREHYGMGIRDAAFMLGLLGAAQFVPLFVLTPVAGVVADRFDRRRVVPVRQRDRLRHRARARVRHGQRRAQPAVAVRARRRARRRARVPRPRAERDRARTSSRRAAAQGDRAELDRLAGGDSGRPAAGGFLFHRSPSLPYFIAAGILLASGLLISTIRPVRAVHDGPPRHPLKQIADGFRFVRGERFLMGCITLDLFAVLLGGATAMLPVFARDILTWNGEPVGAQGLGLMRGAPAVGASLVAAWLSWKPLERNVGEKMLWAVVGFGAATIGFAFSTWFPLSLVLLALLGAADMVSVFIRNSLVQLNTPDTMRGRVSAISGLAISASNELGELQSGLAAGLLGAAGAVAFGGVGAIVVTAIWAVIFPELRKARTFAPTFLHSETASKEPAS
jgi:hypothetical protein